MSTNLWPEFNSAKLPRSPKAVVEEAGAGLSEKTEGVVQFRPAGTSIKGEVVEVRFTLYTPALQYFFPFMRIKFGVQSMYPVTVTADKMDDAYANDEKELNALLANIFTAPSTVTTIERLLSLAKE